MIFNSYVFLLVFAPVVIGTYYYLCGSVRLTAAWLILASFFFYGWMTPALVALLAGSSLFNYGTARLVANFRNQGKTGLSRGTAAFGIAAGLGALAYFKYVNFFLGVVSGGGTTFIVNVALPIGISFYTFTQIAFLVDVARGEVTPPRLSEYLLFVSFFPHLVAGPIYHHRDMIPQFRAAIARAPQLDGVAVGLSIFAFGLTKKTVLADHMAPYADALFARPAGDAVMLADAWTGTLAYTLQIYFDFSAYSDMAVGLALMMGIRLPINFNSPYKATSIIDFWNCWHISLSRFLRDYVYIPLGGNRRGTPRRYANLMATMLIGGLWHGAGWTFVVWGGLHGGYLLINHFIRAKYGPPRPGGVGKIVGKRLTVLLAVLVAWVFFRAGTLDQALTVITGMLGVHGAGALPSYGALAWMATGMVIVLAMPNTLQVFQRFNPVLPDRRAPLVPIAEKMRWQPSRQWILATAAAFVAGFLAVTDFKPFLYYQF